jgi:hypothetical protein
MSEIYRQTVEPEPMVKINWERTWHITSAVVAGGLAGLAAGASVMGLPVAVCAVGPISLFGYVGYSMFDKPRSDAVANKSKSN